MSKRINPGTTSYTGLRIRFVDDSGLSVSGLVAATMPNIYYSTGANSAAVQITLSDLAAITSAYSSGGVKEDTGSMGVYRLDPPNAMLASGPLLIDIYAEASGKRLMLESIDVSYPGALRTNTAQAGGNTTITLDSGAVATDNYYTSTWIAIINGTGAGQVRMCASYVGSTKVATIAQAWAVNPDNTSVFAILPASGVDVESMNRVSTSSVTAINANLGTTQAITFDANNLPKVDIEDIRGTASVGTAGYVAPDWGHVNAPTTTVNLSGTTISAVSGAVGSVTGAVGSVTGNVGGNVVGSVGSVASGGVTSASLAASAITAIRSLASGTAQSGSTTTLVDTARTEVDTDYWKDCLLLVTSGSAANESRLITGFNASTHTLTFAPALTQAITTNTYEILHAAFADLYLWNGSAPNNLISGRVDANTQATAASLTFGLVGNVTGNLSGSVGSVTGAVGSVTGAVGSVAGNVSGSVVGDVQGKVLGGGSSTITGSGVQASSVVGSVGSVTGAVGSVTGSVGSVAGNVSGDVAGKVLGGGASSITGDGVRAASVTGAVGSVTGAVGSVTGNVGGISGVSFPGNFGSLSIDTNGRVEIQSGVTKNVALNDFQFFMVLSTDHVTPATGLTITAQRSLDGGAFASCANAVTELANGVYTINLAASDMNAGVVTLKFTATGADQRTITIRTTA